MDDTKQNIIKEKEEYASLLAVREYIDDLVKNCFSLYESFTRVIKEEEARNEPLKSEFREYNYHDSYSDICAVDVQNQDLHSDTFDSYEAFQSAVNNGHVQGLNKLTIRLDLSFRRGKETELVDHNHAFKIEFKPELTTFSYEANFSDPTMEQMRDNIKKKLDDFPSTRTIFTKD